MAQVTLLEFRLYFWHQKTRVHGLSYGIVCVILHLVVLSQYRRVTGRRTDRHTTTAHTVLAELRMVMNGNILAYHL